MNEWRLLPERAAAAADGVDRLFYSLLAFSVVVTLAICGFLLYCAVKYRAGKMADRQVGQVSTMRIEVLWTTVPLLIALVIFAWGARLFFGLAYAPADALQVFVTGKQWMWKFQHPQGRREIDELHVPLGRPIKLVMTSEDVIHSLFVPAFRIKQDVLPGRYTTLWFQPSKPGTYRLFCTQYCGTDHSLMVGRVVVLEAAAYAGWLKATGARPSLAQAGAEVFQRAGCAACHGAPAGRGPRLDGLFGRSERLQDGSTVIADETYLRESILRPNARLVAGYQPIMPAYEGQLSEEQVQQVIAYLKEQSIVDPTPPPLSRGGVSGEEAQGQS